MFPNCRTRAFGRPTLGFSLAKSYGLIRGFPHRLKTPALPAAASRMPRTPRVLSVPSVSEMELESASTSLIAKAAVSSGFRLFGAGSPAAAL